MPRFVQKRHSPPSPLSRPRELIVALPPLRSNVNLSRIVRTAGCCGVRRVIACGRPKVDPKIARDSVEQVEIESHRTLPPALTRYQAQGYQLVGVEQTTQSQDIHSFRFQRRTVLVVGSERLGLTDEVLGLLDVAVEIPVYGLPYSYNVATSVAMALYEYCRQFPRG
jgi:tRNA G18 (ribose-2'-O)-methylase SpoU